MTISLKLLIKTITPLLFIFFVNTALHSQPLEGQVIEKIVAKVDDEIILKSDLDVTFLQLSSSQPYTPELECQVLETLIVNKLLVAKAGIDSVTVEESQVEGQLERRMSFLLQQFGGTPEMLVEKYGKTIEEIKSELRDQVREQLIVQQMQQKITSGVTVTPKEVKRFFKEIPQDSLPYYSMQMVVGQIVKKPVLSSTDKEKVEKKLEDLKARILNGESFEDLARQYSQDPGSAARGGSLGNFKRGDLVPEYEAAALRLKPGQLSDIVESQFGFHLIRLDDRRGNEYNSSHILLKINSSQSGMDNARNILDSLKRKIENGELDFAQAAHAESDDPMTKSNGGYFMDQKTGDIRIPAEDLDPTLYFTVEKMNEGDISDPMPYSSQSLGEVVRIIYLKEKMAPHEANMNDDYQKIQSMTLNQKQSVAIDEWFAKTKDQIFIQVDPKYNQCEILK